MLRLIQRQPTRHCPSPLRLIRRQRIVRPMQASLQEQSLRRVRMAMRI
jgi:hypothetical protein